MLKVGIMSMQRIINYGSFLQAYALKQIIEDIGCQIEFVDYHIEKPLVIGKCDNKNKVLRNIKKGLEIIKYKAPLSHKLAFIRYKQTFAKKYMQYLQITDKMNYTPELECLVIGSDEVFNCIQSNSNVGYSPELFGKNNRAKKLISYAASFGNTTFSKLEKYGKKEEIGDLLKKFDNLSVRDFNSSEIVYKISGIKPEYHLDPVLAYDFMNKCKHIPATKKCEKYLLVYAYSGRITELEADWIAIYAKKNNLKVYALGGVQRCADRFIDCSPFEVFDYFRNAEEVITDTYHGSIFSIITHRKFATIVRKSEENNYGNEEKLTDLLQRFQLAERMTFDIHKVAEINERYINFDTVDLILMEERKRTELYLKKNLI